MTNPNEPIDHLCDLKDLASRFQPDPSNVVPHRPANLMDAVAWKQATVRILQRLAEEIRSRAQEHMDAAHGLTDSPIDHSFESGKANGLYTAATLAYAAASDLLKEGGQ